MWIRARYRVAVMLWMFLLLGAAHRESQQAIDLRYVLAALALGLSYICATSLNDVADRDVDRDVDRVNHPDVDRDVDRVNHPDSTGRPLVRGEATVTDLYLVHAVAASAAVGLAVVGVSFLLLWRTPERAVIGYRG